MFAGSVEPAFLALQLSPVLPIQWPCWVQVHNGDGEARSPVPTLPEHDEPAVGKQLANATSTASGVFHGYPLFDSSQVRPTPTSPS